MQEPGATQHIVAAPKDCRVVNRRCSVVAQSKKHSHPLGHYHEYIHTDTAIWPKAHPRRLPSAANISISGGLDWPVSPSRIPPDDYTNASDYAAIRSQQAPHNVSLLEHSHPNGHDRRFKASPTNPAAEDTTPQAHNTKHLLNPALHLGSPHSRSFNQHYRRQLWT